MKYEQALNNILSTFFTKDKTTQDVVQRLLQQNIQSIIDNSISTIGFLVDLKQGFDTVSTSKILEILEGIAFTGLPLKLMQHY